MSKKGKNSTPAKAQYIHFRVPQSMYDIITIEAENAKLSVSEYCRRMLEDNKT